MEIIKEQLKAVVGEEHVICEPEDLKSYAQDNITFIPPRSPLLAVKPGSVEEIQSVLKVAALNKMPVTPSSSRTNGHGGSIPSIPGVIIDLRRLNRIHLIDDMCRNAVIEPGVTFAELQKSAKARGLRVLTPIELPAESSVISTHVEMTPLYSWPKYGTESILTMEVLLPNGELIKTGMAAIPVMDKAYFPFGTMPAYLNKVFCGAQGTLGIVTRATIKLKTDFETQRVLFIPFTSFEASFPVLKEIKRLDSPVEFFIADATYLAGLLSADQETFSSLQHTLSPQTAVLVLRGEKEQVEYQVADLSELAEKMNVELLDALPADREAAKKLLQEIEFPDGYEKFKKIKGYYGVIPFICMTRQLPIFNRVVADIARGFGYDVKNIGSLLLPVEPSRIHFQFAFYTGPAGSEDYKIVEKLFGTMSSTLLRMGAFFSRPYGLWAGQVYAKAGTYKAMLKQIKEAIDPENIMNPGKLNL